MNCDRVREELELNFGTANLSAEIADHLHGCEACCAYHAELLGLVPKLGDDDSIELSFAEIEHTVQAVEKRIAPAKPTQVVSPGWFRPAVRFAAAAAIVLFAYGAYQLGQMQGMSIDSRLTTTAGSDSGSLTSLLQSDIDMEMDDDMVSVLIDEFSTGASLGVSETLIDDISEEEMKYLEEHIEIGDLL